MGPKPAAQVNKMNMKALGVAALIGLIAVGLIAGTAVASSPSSASTVNGTQTSAQHGHCYGLMNQGNSNMNGPGPYGNCTGSGQMMNGTPGFPDCPYYPSGNCTGDCGIGPKRG